MSLHVVILVHEHGALDDALYTMGDLASHWRALGHRVTVARGPRAVPHDADFGILHVDATRIDPSYAAALARCKATINAATLDISKRRISSNLVRKGDGYTGPVIVKTDANHAGVKEVDLAVARGGLPGLALRIRNKLPWFCRTRLKLKDYRIFDSPGRVPWPVWMNRDLVVERLFTERRGSLFLLRCWLFFGDRGFAYEYESDEPIITARNVKRITFDKPIPDDLREFRRRLNFDFGKFDFVQIDGRSVLFDANRTPTDRALRPCPGYADRVKELSLGLASLVHAPSLPPVLTA